jgi:8-oxo-dGTP diphosphatase
MPVIRYNLILLLDPTEQHVLMCKRMKEPYLGKYNLCGGKIEPGEDALSSAYRELFEETGITADQVVLHPFMDFVWHAPNMKMEVFLGRLDQEVELFEEAHPLEWVSLEADFFDTNRFAGEGNIGHMIAIYRLHRGEILG